MGSLELELFDGESLRVDLTTTTRPRPGSTTVFGGDSGGDHLVLSVVGDAAAATIWHDDRLFGLQHARSGELLLVERQLEAPGTCGVDHTHHVGGERGGGERGAGGTTGLDSDACAGGGCGGAGSGSGMVGGSGAGGVSS